MVGKISAAQRRQIEQRAAAIRLDGIRRGLATEEIVTRIHRELPELFALEAWRLANGWTRAEVSARIDQLYEADGLAPPSIDAIVLCRWELGARRPAEERIEYFCRLYRTRPDRLGFGTDHSPIEVGHLRGAGIVDAFPYTSQESEDDLLERIRDATKRINMFGLTRNFYGRDDVLSLFEARAQTVPVALYVMDPHCDSRRDRYRIEPAEAAMEDPDRYVREVLRPLKAVADRQPNLRIFLFNFPVSFAIEEIDDVCRVMLYGHGKRGTQGPIITFADGSAPHQYFIDQIRWLERLATDHTVEPWASKGIVVRPLDLGPDGRGNRDAP